MGEGEGVQTHLSFKIYKWWFFCWKTNNNLGGREKKRIYRKISFVLVKIIQNMDKSYKGTLPNIYFKNESNTNDRSTSASLPTLLLSLNCTLYRQKLSFSRMCNHPSIEFLYGNFSSNPPKLMHNEYFLVLCWEGWRCYGPVHKDAEIYSNDAVQQWCWTQFWVQNRSKNDRFSIQKQLRQPSEQKRFQM